jgi:hypothetical protein
MFSVLVLLMTSRILLSAAIVVDLAFLALHVLAVSILLH